SSSLMLPALVCSSTCGFAASAPPATNANRKINSVLHFIEGTPRMASMRRRLRGSGLRRRFRCSGFSAGHQTLQTVALGAQAGVIRIELGRSLVLEVREPQVNIAEIL